MFSDCVLPNLQSPEATRSEFSYSTASLNFMDK